jgi:hypothetical protein
LRDFLSETIHGVKENIQRMGPALARRPCILPTGPRSISWATLCGAVELFVGSTESRPTDFLLRAFFEGGGAAFEIRESFAGEMEGAGDQDRRFAVAGFL